MLACSAITCTTMLLARPSSTTAGQSGLAHPQDSTVEPAPRAPNASERRWARVRGSSSHTARAIAATRCLSRRRRGPTAGRTPPGFRCRAAHQRDLRTAGDQLGQKRRGQDATAEEQAGLAPQRRLGLLGGGLLGGGLVGVGRQSFAVQVRIGQGLGGRGLGDDVHDDAAGPAVVDDGRAVRVGARTGQHRGAGAQRAEGVGAALGQGAGVVLAHPAGHRRHPLFEQDRIGAQQPAVHRGGAGGVGVGDGEVAGCGRWCGCAAPRRDRPCRPRRRWPG